MDGSLPDFLQQFLHIAVTVLQFGVLSIMHVVPLLVPVSLTHAPAGEVTTCFVWQSVQVHACIRQGV